MFKSDWEKASASHAIESSLVEKMVKIAYPNKALFSYELIKGGCANINIKIHLQDEDKPLILRIYLREPAAAYREQRLTLLLSNTIPVPTLHYIGDIDSYRFAIADFMPGITLRDLLLGNEQYNMAEVMHDVGVALAKITKFTFPESGFLDNNLQPIKGSITDTGLMDYTKASLEDKNVRDTLGSKTIALINDCFIRLEHLLPSAKERHLVHGDFDPSNILVTKIDNKWKIAGILDWEFAFSGSYLCDVANMLRYAHKMPAEFQESFLSGLTSDGVTLTKNWHVTVDLLNLMSLLDCLKRSQSGTQPNKCADIQQLIEGILLELAGRKFEHSLL